MPERLLQRTFEGGLMMPVLLNVLYKKYLSTFGGVLEYFRGSIAVLVGKYWSACAVVLWCVGFGIWVVSRMERELLRMSCLCVMDCSM